MPQSKLRNGRTKILLYKAEMGQLHASRGIADFIARNAGQGTALQSKAAATVEWMDGLLKALEPEPERPLLEPLETPPAPPPAAEPQVEPVTPAKKGRKPKNGDSGSGTGNANSSG